MVVYVILEMYNVDIIKITRDSIVVNSQIGEQLQPLKITPPLMSGAEKVN